MVHYPPTLDLGDFVRGPQSGRPNSYALCGVVKHTGDLNGGHYTSLARGVPAPGGSGGGDGGGEERWYNFNDSVVTPLVVPPPGGGAADPRVTRDAYLLLYRRVVASTAGGDGGDGGDGGADGPRLVPGPPRLYGGVVPCDDGEWPEPTSAKSKGSAAP